MQRLIKGFLAVVVATSALFAEGGILTGGGYLLTSQKWSGDYEIPSPFEQKMSSGMKIDWQYWYNFTPKMGVLAGISLESRGMTVALDDLSDKFKQHYFEIPLLFSYSILPEVVQNIFSDVAVSVGPEIGVSLFIDGDAPYSLINMVDYAAYADLRITTFKWFVLGVGYSFGLTNIAKDMEGVSGKINNSAIKLFIDYKYLARQTDR